MQNRQVRRTIWSDVLQIGSNYEFRGPEPQAHASPRPCHFAYFATWNYAVKTLQWNNRLRRRRHNLTWELSQVSLQAVLGSINDTCIMIRILILKKYQVSSIIIHFWYSISISITDRLHFGCISIINHWYMTVIHLLEFRTLHWQGLQVVNSSSRVSTTVRRIQIRR